MIGSAVNIGLLQKCHGGYMMPRLTVIDGLRASQFAITVILAGDRV